MFRKVVDGLAIAGFVIAAGAAGSGAYAYLWITNSTNQEKLMGSVIEKVTSSLPIPGGKMVAPKTTGGALPMKGLPF